MLFGPSGGINSAPSIQPPQPQSTSVTTTTMSAREGTTNSHPNQLFLKIVFLNHKLLKDDINNPYTFEEEGFKEIEAHKETENEEIKNASLVEYVTCYPGIVVNNHFVNGGGGGE